MIDNIYDKRVVCVSFWQEHRQLFYYLDAIIK